VYTKISCIYPSFALYSSLTESYDDVCDDHDNNNNDNGNAKAACVYKKNHKFAGIEQHFLNFYASQLFAALPSSTSLL